MVTSPQVPVKRAAILLRLPAHLPGSVEEDTVPRDDHRSVLHFDLPVQVPEEVADPHGLFEVSGVNHQHILFRCGDPVGDPLLYRQDLPGPEDSTRGEGEQQHPAVRCHHSAPDPGAFLRGHGDVYHPQPVDLRYLGKFRDHHG